jgi:DNA-binding GntR family transcriptional regulator
LLEEAQQYFPEYAAAPWLLISETCVTDAGTPILLAWDYFRSDIFTFEFVRQRE